MAHCDGEEEDDAAAEVTLLQHLGLGHESVVVEIGTDTGQLTLAVAPVCARVVAVDASPVLLELRRSKTAAAGAENVEVVQARLLTYEDHGEPAGVVYTRYALHHLPDAWKAIALVRVRQVLRTGGPLRLWNVVYDFPGDQAAERLGAWCATGGDAVEDEWRRVEYEEYVRDEYSTFTWLLEPMMTRANFNIKVAEHCEDGTFAKFLPRAV